MRGSGKRQSAIIAASLGAFFALLVPLQTYLGNQAAPLLRRACRGTMTRQEIDDTLRTPDRLFRYINRRGGDVCLDWVFHEDGTFDSPKGGYATE